MAQLLLLMVVILGSVLRKVESQMCSETPECFGCGTPLVSCTGGNLSTFPDISIDDQQLVESLILSGNSLRSLSISNFENFTALRDLSINSNNLESLESGIFAQTIQLEEVNFQSNELREIPDNLFASTPNLQELNLRSNNIENISAATFSGLSSLAEIDLGINQIQTIQDGSLPSEFAQIKLDGNPLRCDCELGWLPGFLSSLPPSSTVNGECSSPVSLSGVDINALTESQLTCAAGSCSDGVMNNDETDIDCGGTLCPPCQIRDYCTDGADCEEGSVCPGRYTHPSGLLYPFRGDNIICVDEDAPGEAILQTFKDALLGREDALSLVDPHVNLFELQTSVQQEIETQFEIEQPLESVKISTLERREHEGDPLYQTSVQWSEGVSEDQVDGDVQRMINNMNSGKLKGTLLINEEDRNVKMNF